MQIFEENSVELCDSVRLSFVMKQNYAINSNFILYAIDQNKNLTVQNYYLNLKDFYNNQVKSLLFFKYFNLIL